MGFGEKIIPLGGMNVDLHESLMPPNLSRFVKNLVYEVTDTADATASKGAQTGVFKPTESNALYIDNFALPAGANQCIGALSYREQRQVFLFVYNSNQQHGVYRLNGRDQTYDIVYQGPCLAFVLQPEHFIHQGGACIARVFVADLVTGEPLLREFLLFTFGIGPQYNICIEDSIATHSFDSSLFPYFLGNYDPCLLINFGVPTPSDCISVTEVPNTPTSDKQNNRLLFKTWQFRVLYVDVWGRPSEHGIISTLYIPGGSDCIAASTAIARCLDLLFDAPPPHIDKIQVEYRNCNDTQWYLSDVLNLYNGSPLGKWWLRPRNPAVVFNGTTHKISYRFCADKECDALPPTETGRLFNPIPRTSQSVAPIGNFISLGNNKDGFLPFSQDLLDKITFTVTPPTPNANTNNFANISILVEVYNFGVQGNAVIFLRNNRYNFQKIFSPNSGAVSAFYKPQYNQFFKNPAQQGFIGYLAGTNNFVISEQWSLDGSGTFEKVTDFKIFELNKRYFQKFTFTNVKKGIYLFRIAGITTDPAIDSPAVVVKTSTYVKGSFPADFSNSANPVNHDLALIVSNAKELEINVCNGDYDSMKDNKILVIADLTGGNVIVDQGYVFNTDDTTQDQFGVELLSVVNGFFNSLYTDHNGYYFIQFIGTGHYYIQGYCNCKLVSFANNIPSGSTRQQFTDNYFLNKSIICPDYENQVCNFVLIKGKVGLCGSQGGIQGVSVVLARGGTALTDSEGNFTILAHDDVRSQNRTDKLYYITNSCNFTGCEGTACIQPVSVTFEKCGVCQPREVDVATLLIQFMAARGLLSGGKYPVGVVPWDKQKRPGFVQQTPNYYLDIPSVQQTGIFAPSTVSATIAADAIFPEGVEEITFWIGAETTIADYVTWIVDNVQFIDNTGLVNNLAPTQIKIFYASLVEYNKQNNFNTTVNWNFIATGLTTPVLSDKVEFLLNGDGTFFSKSITALVKYDTVGQFFLIDYTADLKDLKANAIIRIVRPKACTGTEPYYELCSTIKIVNRKAVVSGPIVLNAFDTYYLNRQIPVPTLQPNSSPPVFINEPRIFGVPFEHNSPSDFWGLGCHNIGRVNSKNPYETVIFTPEQIALSGALSPTGQLNFLNYFDDAKKRNFPDTGINGIVSILPETATILVLGQSDSFVVGFNDNIVRVTGDGVAVAPSIQDQFGQPMRKVGSNYGCQLFDKNTIYKKEGLVLFLDSSKTGVILHDYQTAKLISDNGAQSQVRSKIKEVQAYNLVHGDSRYFTGIINPINHGYLLTDFIINGNSFINNLRTFDVTAQETIEFDIYARAFKTTWSFTPECFAELEGELGDQQLFSMRNGIPWRHYTTGDPKTYNNFYGTQVERVLEVVIVMDNLKKKKPLSLAEYCKQGAYFVDRVVTETGQVSRILLPYFLQAEFGWYAPFLCDLNTPADPNYPQQTGVNALLDGNMLVGTWIKLRMIGDPAINDLYNEFQGIACQVFPSEKSGV